MTADGVNGERKEEEVIGSSEMTFRFRFAFILLLEQRL
jgi:hypothetical protein